MLNIIGLHIEINRGDAAYLTFRFNGDDAPEDGTEVVFQVVNRCHTDDALIEKNIFVEDGRIHVSFVPEDTGELEPGLYHWNISVQYFDGKEPWTVLRDWQDFQILPGFLKTTPIDPKEPYEGPYTVVSHADVSQILDTKNKIMTENLIVLPISYYETSNPKGGMTVYIGVD